MATQGEGTPQLVEALKTIQARYPALSIEAMARNAQVAPVTLREVLAQKFITASKLKLAKPRKVRGWVEALARLVVYVNESQLAGVNLDASGAIAEFGIDIKSKSAAGALDRVITKQKTQVGLSDFVLNNIAERARPDNLIAQGITGVVTVGILQWQPFSAATLPESWGYKFCMRLLGSLNPRDWKIEAREHTTIYESLAGVRTGPDFDDISFGVYDTVSRQLQGIKFVHIPGIGVPLHAIHYRPPGSDLEIMWDQIARPSPNPVQQLKAFALEGEIGELYLRGPCQYHSDNIQTIKSPEEIARVLLDAEYDPARTYIFCADRPTCKSVLENRDIKKSFAAVKKDGVTFPAYRLGLAFRADAERWGTLLETAVIEELFRNDVDWTVDHYLQLLRSYDLLALVPLEPQLPSLLAKSFAERVSERVSKDDLGLPNELREDLERQLAKVWGSPNPQRQGP